MAEGKLCDPLLDFLSVIMFTGIWTSHRSNDASIWCAAILPSSVIYGGLLPLQLYFVISVA